MIPARINSITVDTIEEKMERPAIWVINTTNMYSKVML